MAIPGFVVAVLGAECTGKSTLADQMRDALVAQGRAAMVVPEALRAFGVRHGRTPQAHEQRAIADAQTALITHAAQQHPLVIADTTALMTAVYSEQFFGDTRLYAQAMHDHRRCDLTLLAAPDLSWQADGFQRDGPAAQKVADALLRQALDRGAVGYAVVTGSGPARLRAAIVALERALAPAPVPQSGLPRGRYRCRDCELDDCLDAAYRNEA